MVKKRNVYKGHICETVDEAKVKEALVKNKENKDKTNDDQVHR